MQTIKILRIKNSFLRNSYQLKQSKMILYIVRGTYEHFPRYELSPIQELEKQEKQKDG